MVKLFYIVIMSLLFASAPIFGAEAKDNQSADLKRAQKSLAAGDFAAAYQQYQKLAEENDNPLAQFSLALFYDNGWGRTIDQREACRWYVKAAAGDIPSANHFAGECKEDGKAGPADPAGAAVFYRRAADLGHTVSLCSLGNLYITGSGVAKDTSKGLELCGQAASQGLASAQVRMGQFLLEGDPAIRDYDQAINWFELAAENKSLQAYYSLGIMARDGLGMEKNRQAAINWLEQAASQGYVAAYLPTGQLYITPPPGAENLQPPAEELAKAYLWLSAAKNSASNQDRADAEKALEGVLKTMPASWAPDLDQKVAQHLAEFPPQQQPGLK